MSQIHARIQGVNFPPGVPTDFAAQIQGLLKKYNQIVDDNSIYRETIFELRKLTEQSRTQNQTLKAQNESLKSKYESLQDEHEELKHSYESLKTLSEKVASKYEARNSPQHSSETVKPLDATPRRPQKPKVSIPRKPISPIKSLVEEPVATVHNDLQKPKPREPLRNKFSENSPESSDDETVLEVE